MRIFYYLVGFTLVVVTGCQASQKKVVPELASVRISPPIIVEQDPEIVESDPIAVIVHFSPEKEKKVFEFVQIDGETYGVPRPWRGKKIGVKSPGYAALQQIPLEYTVEQSKLYILKDACAAFVAMAEAARQDGIHLQAHSAFRSVWYQKQIFTKLMAKGRTWEDLVRYVAPPGYSEHMLGIAVDLYPSNWRFASTPEYEWLQLHAAEYYFVESYPEINEGGFPWESWHWKYVGPEGIDNHRPLKPRESLPETVADYVEPQKQEGEVEDILETTLPQ